MIETKEIIGMLTAFAAVWHVVGFGFGFVYVRLSLLSLLGRVPYNQQWKGVLRGADAHLWLSGFALIALGILDKGTVLYLSNPKLWCKITVIISWMLSTQMMRFVGVPKMKLGNVRPMYALSAVNVSCWVYGAFLGCAKPLGYGVVSYSVFLAGFLGLVAIAFVAICLAANKNFSLRVLLERRYLQYSYLPHNPL